MRKTVLLLCLSIFSYRVNAQYFLSDDFNTDCGSPASFPVINTSTHWIIYNPLSATNKWDCTANGHPDAISGDQTNGVMCDGYNGSYQLDTSYLITPYIYLPSSSYPDTVFLRFDGKKDNNLSGGRMALYFTDSSLTPATRFDLDTAMFGSSSVISPILGDIDSGQWVTHQINLTGYIDHAPFCLAFRYTSTTTTGTAWYIDNVYLTTEPLTVKNAADKRVFPLKIIGQCTSSHISLSYDAPMAGKYRFYLYDMMGRELFTTETEIRSGIGSYTIDRLDLPAGMYCVRMANENTNSIVKLIVP